MSDEKAEAAWKAWWDSDAHRSEWGRSSFFAGFRAGRDSLAGELDDDDDLIALNQIFAEWNSDTTDDSIVQRIRSAGFRRDPEAQRTITRLLRELREARNEIARLNGQTFEVVDRDAIKAEALREVIEHLLSYNFGWHNRSAVIEGLRAHFGLTEGDE